MVSTRTGSLSLATSADTSSVFKSSNNSEVAIKVGTEEVTYGKLFDGSEGQIFEAEKKVFDLKMEKVKDFILNKLIATEAKKKNISNQDFINKFVVTGGGATKREIDEFVKSRNLPLDSITDDMRERIKKYLDEESKAKKMETWLAQQTKNNPTTLPII